HNPAPTTKRIGAQARPRASHSPRPQSPLLRPPHPEPGDERNHRKRRNNQSSQRINLRRHHHPHRREHHHRQSRRPRPGHKARNHQIIQRQSKRQQQPETSAGAITGRVITRKVFSGVHPKSMAASSMDKSTSRNRALTTTAT